MAESTTTFPSKSDPKNSNFDGLQWVPLLPVGFYRVQEIICFTSQTATGHEETVARIN